MLDCAIANGNLKIIQWLIGQGYTYEINEYNLDGVVRSISESQELISWALESMQDEALKHRFINACLFENLTEKERTYWNPKLGQWLIETMNASPFYRDKADKYKPMFHTAVYRGRRAEVHAFLSRDKDTNFHVPDFQGRYPIEIAAGRQDKDMFKLLLSSIATGQSAAISLIHSLYERAIVKHRDLNAGKLFCAWLVKNDRDPGPAMFQKLCAALDFASLEFFVSTRKAPVMAMLSFSSHGFSWSQKLKLHDIVNHPELIASSSLPSAVWKGAMSAASALAKLARHIGKPEDKYLAACEKLAQESGMIGAVMENIMEAGKVIEFVRPAVIDDLQTTHAIDQQLAGFIGYWLPATGVWTHYLNEDFTPSGEEGYSAATRKKLSLMMVDQVTQLHQASQQQEAGWAKQLIGDLPGLCLACILPGTERIDSTLLQRRLLERGVFVQNAKRLLHVVMLAFEAVNPNGRSFASHTAGHISFTEALRAELVNLFRDLADNDITRISTSDSLRLFSETAYAKSHATTDVTPEFAAMRDHMFAEMLWWQMSALREGLGMMEDEQAEQFQKTHGPFLRFKEGLQSLLE